MDALKLLALTPAGGRLEGSCVEGTPGRLFGGHVLAQSLLAASRVSTPDRPLHSAHSHFLAEGRGPSVQYTTAVVKRGRSIDIALVEAWQGERAILTTTASFHRPEPSAEFQVDMPPVTAAEDLPSTIFRPPGTNPKVRARFEIRYPDGERREDKSANHYPELLAWVRTREPVPSSGQIDHQALLTYAVDFLITRAAHRPLSGGGTAAIGSSIDHAMWFHRPFRMDEWLLIVSTGLSFAGSRSLCRASVFDAFGRLVASGMQEALLRSSSPQ